MPRHWLPVALALAGVFAALAVLVSVDASRGWIEEHIDGPWNEWMLGTRTAAGVDIARVFDFLGSVAGAALVYVAIGAVLLWQRRPRAIAVLLVGIGVASGGSTLWKLALGRPRPAEGLVDVTTSAFPSGHVVTAAYAGALVVLLLIGPGARRRAAWAVAVAVVIAMAWSRTYLSVHWLTDTVGGAAWGLAAGLVVLAVGSTTARSASSPRRPRGRSGDRHRRRRS